MHSRTPEEIRASIELNRQQLGTSLDTLRREVVHLVGGFVIGGGVAALGSLVFGRRRRRRRAELAHR